MLTVFLVWLILVLSSFAKEIVKLNALKVRYDERNQNYQPAYKPHVVVDIKNKHKRDGNGVFVEILYSQVAYFVEMEVGSNNNKILVNLDTGSSDFWINGQNNSDCYFKSNSTVVLSGSSTSIPSKTAGTSKALYSSTLASSNVPNNCSYKNNSSKKVQNKSKYNKRSSVEAEYQTCEAFGIYFYDYSSTFQQTNYNFSIKYADGTSASGPVGLDDVYIGNTKVSNVSIGVSNSGVTNGVLGLGFPVNESPYQIYGEPIYQTLPYLMKSQGLIERALYSIKGRIDSEDYLSEILFGAYDRLSFAGALTKVPIVNYKLPNSTRSGNGPYYLSITLSSMTFDNDSTPFASGAAPAILDTGAGGSYFPQYIIDQLTYRYGFEISEELSAIVVSENKIKDSKISFNFQGCNIEIPLIYFTYPVLEKETYDYSGLRMLSVYPSGESVDYFIFGDDFLSRVSLIVDMEDEIVVLGEANLSQTVSDVVIITNDVPGVVIAKEWTDVYGVKDTRLNIIGDLHTQEDMNLLPSQSAANLTSNFVIGEGIPFYWD